MGESVWCSQRDLPVRLSEFEMAAYGMSCKVILSPSFTFATLDDDLCEVRTVDNLVKTTNSRKTDKEGHIVDTIVDGFFRIALIVRFRRRENHKPSM